MHLVLQIHSQAVSSSQADRLVFVSGGFSLNKNIWHAKMYMHSLCGACARTHTACQLKIKEELLNMFLWKQRERKKKITGRPNTPLSAKSCGNTLKHQKNNWENLCIPVRQKQGKKASSLQRKFGHTTNSTQCTALEITPLTHFISLPFSYWLYWRPVCESMERQSRQMEIAIRMCTVVQQMCQCMLFCINAFIILPVWADVMQGLSARNNTLLQFPLQPAVKKQALCASASLPAWFLL